MKPDKEYILKMAHENRVKFIRLWFTDILGFLKSFAITLDELEDALEEGVRFDGSTLDGFIRTEEREMLAVPDPATFAILPWRPRDNSVARLFCDIHTVDGKPFEGDSRHILKKNLLKAAEAGLTFYTGPEIEFFFFKNSKSPEILDRGGYFDLTPLDSAADYRRQTVLTLEDMGIGVISSHHEGSPSQHEIDLRHDNALATADNIMSFRLIAKEIGQLNDIYASFMPKPLADQNGSGLHIHQSLFSEDKNTFFDSSKENNLSENARYFIAGLLAHSREYTALTNQWINSYKRTVEGFESPTHATWGVRSQEAMVRVPNCPADKPSSMRIELRSPDPSCNPYLVFSTILAAGLKGIENKYTIPESLDTAKNKNAFVPLPCQLQDALREFESSELIKSTLGSHIQSKFLENKEYELKKFSRYITDFEINEYLPIL